MRYQVPALAACPPGYFAPSISGYNAYGAPVVLHDTGDKTMALAGGIFARTNSLEGFGDASSDQVGVWIAQAKNAAEALLRQAWAAANPGKAPPTSQPSGTGLPQLPAPDAGIFGIPTPVAVVGGLVVAMLVLNKKK